MEERLWEIRDIFYGAVQAQIANNLEDQQTRKQACEALSTLLNSLSTTNLERQTVIFGHSRSLWEQC